ncbi:hypothetical protein D9980_10695 [Serratia sp. 3ACOL1]|uniref:hypothetical protein n=1 Tax=Serratia sp. 3ACOL1 TaxID=2448483 RepID=UPI000EF4D8EE|nr:hypothetical protein [Serratia sp. 3ACOL1]AYM91015.1 hypothetical protein D9980_10695 [Serratia sp. 3ACOL1]
MRTLTMMLWLLISSFTVAAADMSQGADNFYKISTPKPQRLVTCSRHLEQVILTITEGVGYFSMG